MRDAILARVWPLVDRFANELADLATARLEHELERLSESIAIALSAYASDAETDILTRALGPELAGMLHGPATTCGKGHGSMLCVLSAGHRGPCSSDGTPKRERDYKPENYPPSRRDREDRAAPQANGKKPVTCQACGFVGGNARGCGRSHPTLEAPPPRTVRPEAPTRSAGAIEADREQRRERIERVASKAPRSGKPPELGMRARPAPPAPAPFAPVDDQDDDEIERWPASRIAEETARAEASKHEGELPEPRSTFAFIRGTNV